MYIFTTQMTNSSKFRVSPVFRVSPPSPKIIRCSPLSYKRDYAMMIRLMVFPWIVLLVHLLLGIHLNGTFAMIDDGIEFVYQIPRITREQWKGIIFIAHGSHNSAVSFWPKGPGCEQCFGQPLSQAMILGGLQRNYVMLAGTAVKLVGNPQYKRYSWSNADFPRIVRLLHYFYEEILHISPNQLPLHLWGVSNGGYYMGAFAQNTTWTKQLQPISITTLTPVIASMKLDNMYTLNHKFTIPTHFVITRKDGGIYWEIQKIIHLFTSINLTLADPEPITKDYFLQRGMGIFTNTESELLAELFHKHHLVDDQYYLLKDPISFNYVWRQMIRTNAPEFHHQHLTQYEMSGLNQLLCSAYAYHGHPVQQYTKVYEFIDQYSNNHNNRQPMS